MNASSSAAAADSVPIVEPTSGTRVVPLRNAPILSPLVCSSLPNLITLCCATIVSIAGTAYVGAHGVSSLGASRSCSRS